jgi:hypothetical protein
VRLYPRRTMVKIVIALTLALGAVNVVPGIGAVRLDHDVQQEWTYCVNVTDRAYPWYCDPDAVRLNVEERPDAGRW